MKLHHVAVVCRSRGNADRFYGEVLGLETIKEKTLDKAFMDELFGTAVSSELVLYGNDHTAVEVFVPESFTAPPPLFAHCCLSVEKRQGFVARCQEKGVAVKQVFRGNSVVVFIQDYDGNQFEIKEMT